MLAIRLMRMGAKKRPSYRIVVKEKLSKRDGACIENLGTYDPTRDPAEVKLNLERTQYWIANGAQPTATVNRIIKSRAKAVPESLESLESLESSESSESSESLGSS